MKWFSKIMLFFISTTFHSKRNIVLHYQMFHLVSFYQKLITYHAKKYIILHYKMVHLVSLYQKILISYTKRSGFILSFEDLLYKSITILPTKRPPRFIAMRRTNIRHKLMYEPMEIWLCTKHWICNKIVMYINTYHTKPIVIMQDFWLHCIN